MTDRKPEEPALAPEQRLKIEELAELQFNLDEIALILEMDVEVAQLPDVALAYRVGTLRGEAEVRKAIKRMAKQGSGPAQKQYLDMIENRQRRDNAAAREANGRGKKRRASRR